MKQKSKKENENNKRSDSLKKLGKSDQKANDVEQLTINTYITRNSEKNESAENPIVSKKKEIESYQTSANLKTILVEEKDLAQLTENLNVDEIMAGIIDLSQK